MKKYIIIIPVLIVTFILTKNCQKEITENLETDNNIEIKTDKIVKVFYNNENNEISINDYVLSVLSCEMPALFEEEALKAGAVAIRTFYMFKENNESNYIATNSDQCYRTIEDMKQNWQENFDQYYNRLKRIVEETDGEFVTYDGEIIESFYFSMSNGYTENSEEVFIKAYPYLVSVSSTWDKNVNNYEKTTIFSLNEFKSKLGIISDYIDININSYSEGKRIKEMTINNKIYKGTEIRKLLNIRSTDFDIKVEGGQVYITTRGYGHGFGISQYGAN